jgi:protein tyrosine phosphatase (PTP) superfamily phosphohydrolase (DUF442 family)
MTSRALLSSVCALALAACAGDHAARETAVAANDGAPAPTVTKNVPQPLNAADAYATANEVKLPATKPQESHGLHNVFQLSHDIISGSEPEDENALDQLAAKGVKTIISVDGKLPDAAGAAKRGLRYVHIPVQYKGMSSEEMAEIAKTFRELPGPFYVHCFHGKHRGPAAAAVGRIVLDGVTREQALAEMRQWCGTAQKYPGLYTTIANQPIPDAATTRALDFDFPSAHAFHGLREIMIVVPRSYDPLRDLAKMDFAADPEHPDIDALNESQKLVEIFTALEKSPDTAARPEDFRKWITSVAQESAQVRDQLKSLRAGTAAPATLADAKAGVQRIDKLCDSCHKVYRD